MNGETFEIRMATEDDAEEILAIYRPYILHTAVTFEITVPSLETFRERIRQIGQTYPYFVAVREKEIVGYCYANRFREREAFDRVVEVSLYVRNDLRGQGVGGKLYQQLEKELKTMGIRNCYACIAAPQGKDPYLSMDSPKFHEHMGYRNVGILSRCGYKFDRWYNMLLMEKFL